MSGSTTRRSMALLFLPLAAALLTGCPPRPATGPPLPPPPLLPLPAAVAAVDRNFAALTERLAADRLATLSDSTIRVGVRVHDERGRVQSHPDLRGVLRFRPPHDLYLDLHHAVAGTLMHVGSNDRLFWVWVKPEQERLWYGYWADVQPDQEYRVPLSPDVVLAAMGLAPLPGAGQGLRGPVPQTGDDQYYKLLYLASSHGALWIQREYWLDRFPPNLPRVVLFRLPDGSVRLRSDLDDYEPAGDSGFCLARRIRMHWPEQDDSVTMQLGRPSFKDVRPAAFALNPRSVGLPPDRWQRVNVLRPSATASAPAGPGPAATGPARPGPAEETVRE